MRYLSRRNHLDGKPKRLVLLFELLACARRRLERGLRRGKTLPNLLMTLVALPLVLSIHGDVVAKGAKLRAQRIARLSARFNGGGAQLLHLLY